MKILFIATFPAEKILSSSFSSISSSFVDDMDLVDAASLFGVFLYKIMERLFFVLPGDRLYVAFLFKLCIPFTYRFLGDETGVLISEDFLKKV